MGTLQEPNPSIERFGDVFSQVEGVISCAESDEKTKDAGSAFRKDQSRLIPRRYRTIDVDVEDIALDGTHLCGTVYICHIGL
jgi:hypothetical protein